jgi:hypothetical protein
MMQRVSIVAVLGVAGALAVLPQASSLAAAGPVRVHLTAGHVTRLTGSSHGIAGCPRSGRLAPPAP